MNTIIEIGDGWIEAQTGARLQSLETAARAEGWELRSYPSTWVKSTLGGYLGGGSGGIGSVTWGRLHEAGTIKSVDILTVENPPRRIHLEEAAALDVQHTYGSNAIMRRATLRLAPKRDWRQIMVVGDAWFPLMDFAVEISNDKRWNKRLISQHEWPIPSWFKGLKKWIRPDAHLIFFEIEESQAAEFRTLVTERGFEIQHEIEPHEPRKAPMYSDFTYNHTTLWALKSNEDYSYLGMRYQLDRYEEQMRAIREKFPNEVWWHLEILRDLGRDEPILAGLPIFHYTTPERFNELRAFCESIGVSASGAHSPYLDEGIHTAGMEQKFALKDHADPNGLLNPGKLKTYQPGTYGAWMPATSAPAH